MLIQSISAAQYINMRNNAALSMMMTNNTRMGLISSLGNNVSFGSLEALAEMDTQLELAAITNSLEYKIASESLEQIKKQQKEESKHLNLFG